MPIVQRQADESVRYNTAVSYGDFNIHFFEQIIETICAKTVQLWGAVAPSDFSSIETNQGGKRGSSVDEICEE